jgi:hypothetical protein
MLAAGCAPAIVRAASLMPIKTTEAGLSYAEFNFSIDQWIGQPRDVQIFNRALSQSEIIAMLRRDLAELGLIPVGAA